MSYFLWGVGIIIIMFCAVGIAVCLGVFADKLDELIRGKEDDYEQQDI